MTDLWRLAGKRPALEARANILAAVRRFFSERGYLDVDTPVRIPAPAPEVHIDAVPSGDWFLQTSPELCMKRLLAAGYPAIYSISRCFRAGERGSLHLPEFTLLEWYRSGADYGDLMTECEALLPYVAAAVGLDGTLTVSGRTVSLAAPWERLTVAEAFRRWGGMPLEEALAADRFEEILTARVEPRLGMDRPTFLHGYPASMAALARLSPDDPAVAERFELYIGGLELANAFSELTDPVEQRRRFSEAETARRAAGKAPYPLPEPFLADLAEMPASAGIALGLDRLVMLLIGARSIDDVVAFVPESL